jgi:hypothetical protein
MVRRAGVIALLIFEAIWLNVIVPGHTRGAVTLPGFEPDPAHAAHSCCAGSPEKSDGSKDSRPGSDRAAHCAICFFAVRLCVPAAVCLDPGPLELLCSRPDRPAVSIIIPESQPIYLGRGPPRA